MEDPLIDVAREDEISVVVEDGVLAVEIDVVRELFDRVVVADDELQFTPLVGVHVERRAVAANRGLPMNGSVGGLCALRGDARGSSAATESGEEGNAGECSGAHRRILGLARSLPFGTCW